ncbi:MAG TPA: hypothetical protein VGG86_05220 [Roseiarcus sp.]|jgi:hypothetical protein
MPSLDKPAHEIEVFKKFVAESGLPIDAATIENREPDEPDIRCVHDTDGPIAFELVQLTSPEIAKNVGDQIKRGAKPELNWTADPTEAAIRGKISKKYETDCPIELLCYTRWTVSLDDSILEMIERITSDQGLGPFRRIWLLGEEVCCVAAESHR